MHLTAPQQAFTLRGLPPQDGPAKLAKCVLRVSCYPLSAHTSRCFTKVVIRVIFNKSKCPQGEARPQGSGPALSSSASLGQGSAGRRGCTRLFLGVLG